MANHPRPESVNLNCSASEQALMDRLDGLPITDSAALARHLARCPACRELHAAAGRLDEGLRRAPSPVPPPYLSDRIVAAVLADSSPPRRWPQQTRRALALAASVLLLLFLAGEQQTRYRLSFPPPKDDAPVASLRDSVAEAGSAVFSLTARTADETVGQTRLLMPVVAAPPLDDPMSLGTIEPPMKSLFGASQGVSAGLEPVTNSARRAVGLFLRELPPMNPEPGRPGI